MNAGLVFVPFLAFSNVRKCTTFLAKFIFPTTTSKSRVRSCTTSELVFVPHQESLFAPLPKVGNFWPFYKIESDVGILVVQFMAFKNVGYTSSDIT